MGLMPRRYRWSGASRNPQIRLTTTIQHAKQPRQIMRYQCAFNIILITRKGSSLALFTPSSLNENDCGLDHLCPHCTNYPHMTDNTLFTTE